MTYSIVVTTEAVHVTDRYEHTMWTDRMKWAGVDDAVVEWFAGSCKAALGWYVNYPETVADDDYYVVRYSTIITDMQGNECPGTVRDAELDRLDYAGLVSFQRFALEQLRELLLMLEERHGRPAAPTRRRSKLGALTRLVLGAIRAEGRA